MKAETSATNIDLYIKGFPHAIQIILQKIRKTIKQAAPQAEEAIKYGMPTFVFGGNLVHFAAFKNHIGFYPTPSGIHQFQKELSSYKTSKGAIQFPLDQRIPFPLIAKIVKFRVKEKKAECKKGR